MCNGGVCVDVPARVAGRAGGEAAPLPASCGSPLRPPRAHRGCGSPSRGGPRVVVGASVLPRRCRGGARSPPGSAGVQGDAASQQVAGQRPGSRGSRWRDTRSCGAPKPQSFSGGGLGEGRGGGRRRRRYKRWGTAWRGSWCPVGKLGNCFAPVAYGNNILSSANKVRLYEDGSVCESKAARRSLPRALISCDTKSIFLVTSCDGINRGIGCGASRELQVFFFSEEDADFCIDNGTLPLIRCRHNRARAAAPRG